jgi:hypothetical protein
LVTGMRKFPGGARDYRLLLQPENPNLLPDEFEKPNFRSSF